MSERCEDCEHPVKASELLDKAAQIVETDGWYQGEFYRPVKYEGEFETEYQEKDEAARKSAPCCQSGAISRAATGFAWLSFRERREFPENVIQAGRRAEGFMNEYVQEVLRFGAGSAVSWNDQPERTADEVAAALRGAAGMARAAGD